MKAVIKCYPQQYYIAIKQSNRHIESHSEHLISLTLAHQEFTTSHKSINTTRQANLHGICYLRCNPQKCKWYTHKLWCKFVNYPSI